MIWIIVNCRQLKSLRPKNLYYCQNQCYWMLPPLFKLAETLTKLTSIFLPTPTESEGIDMINVNPIRLFWWFVCRFVCRLDLSTMMISNVIWIRTDVTVTQLYTTSKTRTPPDLWMVDSINIKRANRMPAQKIPRIVHVQSESAIPTISESVVIWIKHSSLQQLLGFQKSPQISIASELAEV